MTALAALVSAGAAGAFAWCVGASVHLTKAGPDPLPVTVIFGDVLDWIVINSDAVTRITVPDIPCSVRFSIGGTSVGGCWFKAPGTYSYSVEGFGAGSGTIVVVPPPLQVVPNPVIFGEMTVLSGQVPSRAECYGGPMGWVPPVIEEEATVLAKPYGEAELRPLTTVTALGARGDFALLVTPTIGTTYEARLGDLETITAIVEVQPRIELHRLADRSFVVHAEAARSLAGAEVQEQVRKGRPPWRSVTTLQLDDTGSARFDAERAASRIRIFMSAQEAGPGYVSGFSRAITL